LAGSYARADQRAQGFGWAVPSPAPPEPEDD